MKHTRSIRTLIAGLVFLASLVGYAAIAPATVLAADPGCYVKSGDTYTKVANSSCASSTMDPTKDCFYIAQGAPTYAGYKKIDCGTFNTTVGTGSDVQKITYNNVNLTGGQCGGSSGASSNNGATPDPTKTSINLGCKGEGNPIIDMLLAFARFMSAGVGVVLVAAVIVVGIRYTFARGDANTTAQLKMHLFYIMIGLIIYLFSFAILNYVVPGGLLS